jgi:beta-lactamase regulating signal transducer with metallopeptidase domain
MRDFVLAVLIKASVLLGVAGLLAFAWRRSAAARRHLVWAVVLGAVLVLPVVQWLGPIWPVLPRVGTTPSVLPVAPTTAERVHPLAPPLDEVQRPPRREATTAPQTIVLRQPEPPTSPTPVPWLLVLWIGGASLVLISFAIGRWRVSRLAGRSHEVTSGVWRDLFDRLRSELGLRRPVKLLTVSEPAIPMTWGVRHPVVLLPADAASWSEGRRRDVLLHELAHVERQDCLTQLMAVAACAAYWFHPLVWLAAGRLRVERERACDDRVLAMGTLPSEYAGHLLDIARSLRAGSTTALAALAMARPSQLANRLLDVLQPRRREALTRRVAWPVGVGAVVLMGLVAALRPAVVRASDPTPMIVTATDAGGAERPTATIAGPRATTIAQLQTQDTSHCQFPAPRVKNWQSVQEHDEDLVVSSTIGRCVTELRANAKFTFSPDFTDIASVDGGGLVVVEQRGGDVDRRVEIRGGDAGQRRWFVKNDERPYDAEARAWLAATLTDLLRRTGYAAEGRSRWILQTRGVEGEFQEIALLSGDYSKRIYYQALVADGKLDAATVARVIRQAGDEIASDFDLAELLVAVAATYPLTEPSRTAFVTAANHITSDYDRHRVLAVVLAGRNVPDDLAAAILGSAGGIQSDYDLAEVLIVLIQKHPIGTGMREAFFQAVNSIESDYDRHRVLATLLAQREPPSALVADALRSTTGISSDYDRAEVLVQVAADFALDSATRTPFFAAAEGISSDYDLGRVLKAVMERPGVAAASVAGVIASTRRIGSDYDRAEVLVAVAEHAKLNDELRRAFLEAARGIGSEYDRTRALAALGNTQLD